MSYGFFAFKKLAGVWMGVQCAIGKKGRCPLLFLSFGVGIVYSVKWCLCGQHFKTFSEYQKKIRFRCYKSLERRQVEG